MLNGRDIAVTALHQAINQINQSINQSFSFFYSLHGNVHYASENHSEEGAPFYFFGFYFIFLISFMSLKNHPIHLVLHICGVKEFFLQGLSRYFIEVGLKC